MEGGRLQNPVFLPSAQVIQINLEFKSNNNHDIMTCLNPIALRKAKIVYNFGLSECNRVKIAIHLCRSFEILIQL